MFRCLNCAQRFDYRAFGSSGNLGRTAEHLIDGSVKRICRLSFEFYSPHVIERGSKAILNFRPERKETLEFRTNSKFYATFSDHNIRKPILYYHLAYIQDYSLPIIKKALAHGHDLLSVIHNITYPQLTRKLVKTIVISVLRTEIADFLIK